MALVVLLVALATYRLTRLLTEDTFPPIEALRGAVSRRFGEDSAWAYLVECPWCVSIYVGAGVVGATLLAGVDLPVPVWVWLASSALSGVVATVTP